MRQGTKLCHVLTLITSEKELCFVFCDSDKLCILNCINTSRSNPEGDIAYSFDDEVSRPKPTAKSGIVCPWSIRYRVAIHEVLNLYLPTEVEFTLLTSLQNGSIMFIDLKKAFRL